MVVLEEKKIAGVTIEKEGVAPAPAPPARVPARITPTPVPTEEVEAFVLEHERLKAVIEKHGGCINLEVLKGEGAVSDERLEQHVDLFADDDYVGRIVKGAICDRAAISELRKRLEGERE